MSKFMTETKWRRVVTVVKANGAGDVFLSLEKCGGEEGYVGAGLTEEQAVQIAHALLNVAEGKEADADRTEGADVRLLEQRVSALEGQITTVADRITEFTVNEPEQKFYLKVTDGGNYVNWDIEDSVITLNSNSQTIHYQTQFTQAEIDSNPELKKFDSFKIPVPADELAESTGAFRIPVPDGMVISE